MKTLFPGCYSPSEDEVKALWEHGLFIVDANALLNIFCYADKIRGELMEALEKLGDRLWVPHQVVLEFQWNGPRAIVGSSERYDDVITKLLGTKRQTVENVDKNVKELRGVVSGIEARDITKEINGAFEEVIENIKGLKRELLDVSRYNKVKEEIDKVLEGKIGPMPTQKWLDCVCTDGAKRYQERRPPGFEDAPSKGETCKHHGGLVFKNKYGDLILWRQMLEEVELLNDIEHVAFITDDAKEDWWWKKGYEQFGPRPELVEEIREEAGVSVFGMYRSGDFLEKAREYLGASVDDESIKQVRNITDERRLRSWDSLKEQEALQEVLARRSGGLTFMEEVLGGGASYPKSGMGGVEDMFEKIIAAERARGGMGLDDMFRASIDAKMARSLAASEALRAAAREKDAAEEEKKEVKD